MIGVIYVNPEDVKVGEMESQFWVMQEDVVMFEKKGFDGVMGKFNAKIGLGVEDHPNNGKRLQDLVRVGEFL